MKLPYYSMPLIGPEANSDFAWLGLVFFIISFILHLIMLGTIQREERNIQPIRKICFRLLLSALGIVLSYFLGAWFVLVLVIILVIYTFSTLVDVVIEGVKSSIYAFKRGRR